MSVAASTMPATVTSLPVGGQVPSATSSASAATSGTLTESNFLTLLTTQLENQDPLNPQSPSDFAAELAQFSTASGVQTLNSTLGAGSGVQAANLVGKNVAVSGNTLILANGSAQGAFNLSAAASDVQVAITNASGNVVGTIDLGAHGRRQRRISPGTARSAAAATQTAGTYQFTVNAAVGASGTAVTATTYAVAPVTGGQRGRHQLARRSISAAAWRRSALSAVFSKSSRPNQTQEHPSMSLQTELSGVQAAQTNIDTIGNNIANVNTVGFKSFSNANSQRPILYGAARCSARPAARFRATAWR